MDSISTNVIWLANALSAAGAFLLMIPGACLLVLTLSAGRPQKAQRPEHGNSASVRVAILVPAHNESAHVLPTLHCVKGQLSQGDRLIVIADNCEDDTAELALAGGAEVIVRKDATLRGKGYALAFGVDALRTSPPDVVVVVDADCLLSEGAILDIAQRCHQTQCPVQMLDIMTAPPGAGLRTRMLEFAWLVKNKVRPLGSFRLGRACHLMGTGMALPWSLAVQHLVATGHIAEDMKLGVDLAVAGHPTQFLCTSQVTSEFPLSTEVSRVQKTRWEHGHLETLARELPVLVCKLAARPSRALWVLAMDLVIPPLALYFMCLAVVTTLLLGGYWISSELLCALTMALLACTALLIAVGVAWLRFATHLLSLRELLTAPFYAMWKLPVYVAYFLQRKSGWTRTARKV